MRQINDLFAIFLPILMLCCHTIVWANGTNDNNLSIYQSSVTWENKSVDPQILKDVPAWSTNQINDLFNLYKHQNSHASASLKETNQSNLYFINAFWGPSNNPFNKFPRPAKAFVFIPSKKGMPETYYVAPLIQNLNTKDYYVFDKAYHQPILLEDWLTNLKKQHPETSMRINTCLSYGSLPNDICQASSYQHEGKKIYPTDDYGLRGKRPLPSAQRNLNENWKLKTQKYTLRYRDDGSIYSTRVHWDDRSNADILKRIPSWQNTRIIQTNFAKIRDARYFSDDLKEGFLRRISWLYPDDGCWTRAAAMTKDFFGPTDNVVSQYSRPAKVFAFGNLCVNTSNSRRGYVSWWYHTAPIIKDRQTNEVYVIDPSVEPNKALTLEEWGKLISSNTDACGTSGNYIEFFSICNGYGSGPYDACEDQFTAEAATSLKQPTYQEYERSRQASLNRDVDAVLGDLPPWKNNV